MAAEAADVLLQEGRAALAAASGPARRFERALQHGASPDMLDGLSQAPHFAGEYARAIELKERAFAGYHRLGAHGKAAPRALARVPACLRARATSRSRTAGWRADSYRSAIGGLTVTIDRQFSEGEYVATRYTISGTHAGELMGTEPAARKLRSAASRSAAAATARSPRSGS